MRLPVFVAALSLACASAPVAPSQPTLTKEQKVRRLLELTGAEKMGQQMVDAMSRQLQQAGGADPAFLTRFRELAAEQRFVDVAVPIYLKNLDEPTLDGVIAFYESPAGRTFIQAQPVMMQEAIEAGRDWGMKLAKQAVEDVRKAKADQAAEMPAP